MKKCIPLDNPERCQGVMPTKGQCEHLSVEDSIYCEMHGGGQNSITVKNQEMKNYRLTKFKARAEEFSSSSNINSLRDEVAILRILIEEKVNSCNDSGDLLLMSGPLSDLVIKSGALVEKCQKLENRLGNFLDRNKVMQFAQICVEIISNYVDEENMDQVSDAILKALGEI